MPAKELRQNRFDALRLFFALLVVIYHLILLAALAPQSHLIGILAQGAALGVQGFFIISGALVYGSLQRSNTLKLYAEKRVRRLYPAYFLIILIPTIASIFNAPTSALDALHYFAANAVFANFLYPELNAFFQSNPISAVNGALWTIKIEVMFYIALPIIGIVLTRCSPRGRCLVLAVIYIAAELWRQSLIGLSISTDRSLLAELARQLPVR